MSASYYDARHSRKPPRAEFDVQLCVAGAAHPKDHPLRAIRARRHGAWYPHAYGVFATGGRELGLRQETLHLLAAPAIPPARGFYDECMKGGGMQFSLGFMKPTATWPFGSAQSFGSPGAGGSLGFADPKAGIGYGYVTSQMGTALTGDPRDVALRNALYSAVQIEQVNAA